MEEEQVARRVVHPLVELMLHDLNEGPGFGTICIRANDLEVLRKDLENKGIETTGVLYAERKTAAGSLRKWKMLFIKEEVSDSLPAPFFIEWEETDDERYELLQKEGTVNNSNLQLNIESCEFHVENPREVIEKWTSYLNVTYNHQTLFLPNTNLIFKQLKQGTKERLVSVQIKGLPNQEAIVYEQGVYRFD